MGIEAPRKVLGTEKESGRRELIWERIERRSGAHSPTLTVERIVRLAIDLADREGLQAISMRRLAAELNSGVMSLYYYVPGKGDLLDLLLDTIIGETDLPAQPSGNWRRDLQLMARRTRVCLKRHGWALALFGVRPAIGPNRFALTEFALSVISGFGLGIKTMWRMIGSLYVYIIGFVALELSDGHALRQAGFEKLAAPYMEKLLASGKLPNVARYFAAGRPAPPDDEAFEDGLNLVLDGIAAAIEAKRRTTP